MCNRRTQRFIYVRNPEKNHKHHKIPVDWLPTASGQKRNVPTLCQGPFPPESEITNGCLVARVFHIFQFFSGPILFGDGCLPCQLERLCSVQVPIGLWVCALDISMRLPLFYDSGKIGPLKEAAREEVDQGENPNEDNPDLVEFKRT